MKKYKNYNIARIALERLNLKETKMLLVFFNLDTTFRCHGFRDTPVLKTMKELTNWLMDLNWQDTELGCDPLPIHHQR